MAGMKETLELLSTTLSSDAYQTPSIITRTVFADKSPLFGVEFHNAQASGFDVQYVMKVHAFEYDGEKRAIFDGREYEIYRTYEKNDDWTELYLSTRETAPP
jgi:SPP1 family predicted phage head-tail adaptor